MAAPILSVIVPDRGSPEQMKMTLRLLRKYSDPEKIRVFVTAAEKDSPAFAYASSLKWIRFADFSPAGTGGDPRTLWKDFFALLETPFVTVMHAGTVCLRPDWSDYLTGHFDTDRFFAYKCCSLPVQNPCKEGFFDRTGLFFKKLFRKSAPLEQEMCSCLICRKEYLGCCLDLSSGKLRFSDVIFQESVGTLPSRESSRFFCRVGDPSSDRGLSAFYRDILDAGELDL